MNTLPQELILQIIQHSIPTEHTIVIAYDEKLRKSYIFRHLYGPNRLPRYQPQINVNLFTVSKNFMHNCLNLLYSKNIFELRSASVVQPFMKQIGSTNIGRIKCLHIDLRVPSTSMALDEFQAQTRDFDKLTGLDWLRVQSHENVIYYQSTRRDHPGRFVSLRRREANLRVIKNAIAPSHPICGGKVYYGDASFGNCTIVCRPGYEDDDRKWAYEVRQLEEESSSIWLYD